MKRKLEVAGVDSVADEIISITLSNPDGTDVDEWSAGAHIEIELPSGLIRHYSLIGDAHDLSSYRIAVLNDRNGRGGSKELHEIARVGEIFNTSLPRNHFPLVDSDNYLFIAGGIGITPIFSMIQSIRKDGNIPWKLIYGGRSRTSMAFLSELSELSPSRVEIYPEDERGFMPILDTLRQARTGTAIYCCGPSGLIDAVSRYAESLELDRSLHVERFSSTAQPSVVKSETSFQVTLASTGETIEISETESILDVVENIRPDVKFSCREGFCGTCETSVIDGIPDHRDTVLTTDEKDGNECMMICVSRSKTPVLVLDL